MGVRNPEAGATYPIMQTHEERHPDYEPGCAECFTEAVAGGLNAVAMQFPQGAVREYEDRREPFRRAFWLALGDRHVLDFTYEQGRALVLPEDVLERCDALRAEAMVELDRACDEHGEWSREAGDARRHLELVHSWG